MTKRYLAQLLRSAAQAHHTYEQSLGHTDPNWADWYAGWMLPRVQPRLDHIVAGASAGLITSLIVLALFLR